MISLPKIITKKNAVKTAEEIAKSIDIYLKSNGITPKVATTLKLKNDIERALKNEKK